MAARPHAARDDFVAQYLNDRDRGLARDLDSYLAEFPGIEAFIRDEHPKLEAIWLDPGDEDGDPSDTRWIGDYEVIRKIAEGGMGVLYLAKNPDVGREVAIKTLRHGALGGAARARLLREARIMGRLESKHLCEVLHIVEEDGKLSVVMPFVRGETLAERVSRARELSSKSNATAGFWVSIADPGEVLQASETASSGGLGGEHESQHSRDDVRPVLRFMEKIARAIHEAHQNGVVHRDIKPQNIMVQPGGEPMVLDFGLARDMEQLEDSLTSPGEVLGTIFYMPPEQAEAQQATVRSDVYSLGVILYEMLTLARPYAGPTRQAVTQQILAGRVVWPRRLNKHVPPDLEAVCMMAMDRDPNRRYENAEAFAEDLRRVRTLRPTSVRPDTWLRWAVRIVRRNKVRVGVGGAIVSLLAAMFFLFYSWQDEQAITQDLNAIMAYSATWSSMSEAGAVMDSTKRKQALAALARFGLEPDLLAKDRWPKLVSLLDGVLSRSASGQGQQWRLRSPRLVIAEPQPEFVFELPETHEPNEPQDSSFEMRFEVIVEGGGFRQSFPYVQGPADGGVQTLRPSGLELSPGVDYRWSVRLSSGQPDAYREIYQPSPAKFRVADGKERDALVFRSRTGNEGFDRAVQAVKLIERGRVQEALKMLDQLPEHSNLCQLNLYLRAKCYALLGDREALHSVREEVLRRADGDRQDQVAR